MKKPLSFKAQLWFFGIGLFLLVSLTFIWIARNSLDHLIENEFQLRLKENARAFEFRLTSKKDLINQPLELQAFCREWASEYGYRLTLIRTDGSVLTDSHMDPEQMGNYSDHPEIKLALAEGWGFSTRYDYTLKTKRMNGAYKILIQRQPLIIRLTIPETQSHSFVLHFYRKMILAALLLFAIVIALGLRFYHRMTFPLTELALAVRRYARELFTPELAATNIRELDDLTNSLNQMARDLDRRIRMVRDQKEELEAVLRGMSEGVIALDPEHRILKINRAAREMLHPLMMAVEGHLLPEIVRNTELNELLESESLAEIEIQIGTPPRILLIHRARVNNTQSGELAGILVIQDLTQIRSLEQMRQEFVANVSHELKTPITSIKGFTETLQDPDLDSDSRTRFTQTILRQTDRMNALIEDLLELSRLDTEAPGTEISEEPILLRPLWESAIADCAPQIKKRQIAVNLDCPADLRIRGNERLLLRTWVNLLDNAIKYSPEGETVFITIESFDQEVHVKVEDAGPGIPSEHRERIFERFYRVDPGRDREKGGTGLGLAIVRHIVRIHNGNVQVTESRTGGSCFVINLPVEPSQAEEIPGENTSKLK